MPTLPLTPDPMPHQNRSIAESFGFEAERYDRARPRYPQALADAVLADLPGWQILDIGIGTGLSALPFRDADAEVLGVEIDARMAEVAQSRGFPVEVARFEDWDAKRRTFDAVIAGQTWHWIDPAAGATKAASLLKPAGRLAVFWNIGDPEPETAAEFAEVYRSVESGMPFTPWTTPALESYESILVRTTDGICSAGAFSEPKRMRFDWRTTITREAWLDQIPTMGGHNHIPAAQLAALLSGVGQVIDSRGGSFTMNYSTVAIVAAKN
ncbi:class I SAM-dependent methyltransferase (plasmid) [Pseudarthrobacter sp. P1]|uniref:class I SAM-dependent methyltransferase n=1 Tax=Pseudarthrobacter sp. P1 TaxID=3418418 RepID=UPI003CF53529